MPLGGERLTRSIVIVTTIALMAGGRPTTRAQQNGAGQAALKIVVVEGEGAVNIIQQKTAVAPVIEVRDRNDQPVAGAAVRFAIRNGRATFGGARTLSVTTDAAGRAVATGFAPTGNGALQITATAAFQGQTAAAVTIAQTTVATAAQAAAVSGAAGAGASSGGASAGAGAGAGAGGGGGLSATTIGVIAGAVAGGVALGVKALAGGTTLRGDYSGQIPMATVATPGCSFVETLTGTVKITLDDLSGATGTVEVREKHTITSSTCPNNLGLGADDSASGPLSGTPSNLTFAVQSTNPLAGGSTRIKPWSFVGQLNGNEITGVLTTGDINQTPSGVVVARGSSSIPITLR